MQGPSCGVKSLTRPGTNLHHRRFPQLRKRQLPAATVLYSTAKNVPELRNAVNAGQQRRETYFIGVDAGEGSLGISSSQIAQLRDAEIDRC